MAKQKREVEVVVLFRHSFGTYGCHAKELVAYLKSVSPKVLILNGDVIDGWAFSKRYFPNSHMAVLSEFFKMMKKGTQVIYITGNHDEFLRKYTDLSMGNLFLTDKYLLEIEGKKHWIFHGDVFDHTTSGSAKFIAKLEEWVMIG
jgi:UDP-2,3-diacylglucosamine pyrophosphatase LpxH